MPKEPTICVKCKHVLHGTVDYPVTYQCAADPMTNYVTGKPEYHTCIATNPNGTCPKYEEADDGKG